ncbi:MAG TPA: cation:proton antiporter [Salinivirgaceae bacterium]|nr:cation:proton antiporter [Salinivirgaceae bacterium]
MIEIPILKEIVIIIGVSILLSLFLYRFKVPSILVFLITGAIIGPHGLSIIPMHNDVSIFAEIGIVFLLFVIGVEFSIKNIEPLKKPIFLGGNLFAALVVLTSFVIIFFSGFPAAFAVFMGFLLSLSSTAIILKSLKAKKINPGLSDKITIGTAIYQDLLAVPMLLLIPLLAGENGNISLELLYLVVKFFGILVFVYVSSRYIVPQILKRIVLSSNQELFILTILFLCLATAFLFSTLGLSLALGAFIAGLIISESEYNHQVTVHVVPFREIFISFFFVSIGMLLNIHFLIENIFLIFGISIIVVFLKSLLGFFSLSWLGYHAKTAIKYGINLAQVGEFSFILAGIGLSYKLIDGEIYQIFLAVSLVSMGVAPFLINRSEQIANTFIHLPVPQPIRKRLFNLSKIKHAHSNELTLSDHIVIIGYGLNGKNLARAAKFAAIPYIIVEIDPQVVEELKKLNEPVIFGDASSEIILEKVKVDLARIVVIAISDITTAKAIIINIRKLSEIVHIVVRTRYESNINDMVLLGADEVIPEEYETSIEIFSTVLKKYLVPRSIIEEFVGCLRTNRYELLCSENPKFQDSPLSLSIPDVEIVSVRVLNEFTSIVGKSIHDLDLRKNFSVTILAILRNNKHITQLPGDLIIEADDILYLFGKRTNIKTLMDYMKQKKHKQKKSDGLIPPGSE